NPLRRGTPGAPAPMPHDSPPTSATPPAWASPRVSPPRRTGRAHCMEGCDERERRHAMSESEGVRMRESEDLRMRGTQPRLSVVIPAFNEAESLPELHRELVAALGQLGMTWEVLYVDDG